MKKILLLILLMYLSATAQHKPFDWYNSSKKSQVIVYDTKADSFFVRILGTQPTPSQKLAMNQVFVDLRKAGILYKIACWYDLANFSIEADTLNWLSSSYSLTNVGGTFTLDSGWIGGTGKYLNTKFNPYLDSIHFGQNRGSFGIYIRSFANALYGGNYIDMGNYHTNNAIATNYSARFYHGLNGNWTNLNNYYGFFGLFTSNRIKYDSMQSFMNGVVFNNIARASYNPMSTWDRPFYVGDVYPGATAPSPKQYTFAYIGDGLTLAEQDTLHKIIEGYQLRKKCSAFGNKLLIGLGNSLTQGNKSGDSSYVEKLRWNMPNDWRIFKKGHPGLSDSMLNYYYYNHDVLPYYSTLNTLSVLVYWEGTNSLYGGWMSVDSAYKRTKLICQTATNLGYRVVVLSCLKREDVDISDKIIAYNDSLRNGYTSFAYAFCDVNANDSLQNPSNTWVFNADKLHLTDRGNWFIFQDVYDIIKDW